MVNSEITKVDDKHVEELKKSLTRNGGKLITILKKISNFFLESQIILSYQIIFSQKQL